MVYRMSGQEKLTRVEVTDCTAPERIVFEHTSPWKGLEQVVTETYDIRSHGGGVRVVQTIDLSPRGFRGYFVCSYGFCSDSAGDEEPNLHRLKRIIESDKAERED